MCLEETKHSFQTGDYVTFTEVEVCLSVCVRVLVRVRVRVRVCSV